MAQDPLDVVGIGNAIVDVIAHADDAFLDANAIAKGGMTLIDADQAAALYDKMGPGVEMSGGSAANTIAGVATLGGSAGFIGKVRDDQLGRIFAHDIRAIGVHFDTAPAPQGPPTARCLILVTPDAQRSMSTFLGASQMLTPADVDETLLARAQVTYLEGYLFDPPEARNAFYKAAAAAHNADRKVALTLSDAFCVERYRTEFRHLVAEEVDILFANEAEILSLYEVDRFEDAAEAVRLDCGIVALTRSEKGSVVLADGQAHEVAAHGVAKVEDTTGAGDLYAAGFLAGFTQGRSMAACGQMGAIAAAEIISHVGARPEADLKAMVSAAGL
jgi:sugar/nucleoside kinase (ribokinase family)